MKSLVKAKAEKGIWLQDTPKPEVGHNDLLIKIRKTAICGTDMHIGTANSGFANLNQQVVVPDFRLWRVLQPNAFFRLRFY